MSRDAYLGRHARTYLAAAMMLIAVLFTLNLLAAPYFIAPGESVEKTVAKMFMMNQERNLPTLINYGLIVANAFLLAMLALRSFALDSVWRWHWALLCLVFVYLSFDEAASVHERFDAIGRMLVDASGPLAFAWIVPIVPLVAVFGLGYINFLRHQPRQVALLMVASAAVFLSGAVGMEMVGAANFDAHGSLDRYGYHVITGIEESLEKAGMALFGFTLIQALQTRERSRSLPKGDAAYRAVFSGRGAGLS